MLVSVHAASICGTDLHIFEWNGWAAGRIRHLPLTFGHEVAGPVEVSGPRCTTSSPARSSRPRATSSAATAALPDRPGHICENLRILGVDVDGAFAEYLVLPAATYGRWTGDLPRWLPSTTPSATPCTPCSAGGGEDIATNAVAVLGCGPIGLFAIGVARRWRRAGDRRRAQRVPTGPGQGHGRRPPVDPRRRSCGGGAGGDGWHGRRGGLEMSGSRGHRPGHADARPRRPDVAARAADGPVALDLTDQVIFKEARVIGVTGREMFRTWQQTTTLLSTGRVDVAPVITHRFPLERFEEAFEATRRAGPAR